jgi:hypothetical protein
MYNVDYTCVVYIYKSIYLYYVSNCVLLYVVLHLLTKNISTLQYTHYQAFVSLLASDYALWRTRAYFESALWSFIVCCVLCRTNIGYFSKVKCLRYDQYYNYCTYLKTLMQH